jgi:TolB-like protein/Tfp pilus assembly protein PilF
VPRPLWASLTGALAVVGLVAILNPGFWRDRLGGERSIRSLAVLPLANLSGDPEQEFFADGLTEALITRLAQINGLRVTSRTSVMAYKGTRQPLREIARELGVRAILEGSVIRSGPRVRVTAQLIEAGTDRHLWAESYDRDLADVLAIQDDVTSDIADRIRLELSPEQKGRMKQRGAVNPEVYDLYLKGRYFQNQLNPEALAKAVGFYRQAVAIDPRDARAYSGLADAYSIMTIVLSTTSPEEGWPRVREYAEKALSLDPTLADAHVSIGAYQWLAALRWDDAERELRRAVALDPGYALGRSVLGLMLISTGRTEEGIGEVHRSLDLDSLSMFVAANATWGHFYARKLDEADRHGEQLLRVAPHYRSAHAALRAVALAREDYADAIEHEAATLPDSLAPLFRVRARAALAARGARGYWELERELAPQRGLDRFWPSWIAGVEGHLGNLDAAMQWIERAIVVHDGNLAFLAVDPLYDPLRGDPRFQAVLERLGLKEPAPSERAQRGSAVRRPSKV